jgi:hypothetical protein
LTIKTSIWSVDCDKADMYSFLLNFNSFIWCL